jgi:signal transduction histidine kinase
MIEAIKAPIRRRWPRLRLRTILLLTFVFVAALPGVGALFLRVYENTLVRQTEAELIAQSAALAAIASADWPGSTGPSIPPPTTDPRGIAGGALSTIDLRTTAVLPDRPSPIIVSGSASPEAIMAAARLAPIVRATAQTTLASILLLAPDGRILLGPDSGRAYPAFPELLAARTGHAATVLRRNGDYHPRYAMEWLSRASDLRIHHARPVIVNGRVVAILLLSRSPRALFRGLYEDRGKILFGVAAIFATLVILSGLLSRGIARPVEALSEATRAVARGHGQIPEPPATAAIEIQALYADFAVMAAAIERRSRYLRDFAHAVSHEFKTPLAGIRGAVELLEDHHATMSDDERRTFLANARTDADRLALLVTRLLDLARADMSAPASDVSTDLALALRRVCDAHHGFAVAVTLDLPESLPAISVALATVETAVGTLIDNSRQAGATQVDVTAHIAADQIAVVVTDNGPGILQGDRSRIFEPFFTTRRATGGTGLGLPIVRSLLSSSGATIDLLDTADGAAFALGFPLKAPR